MKLSVIALFGTLLAVSGMVNGDCVAKIDKAQACLDICVNIPNTEISIFNDMAYGNELSYCLALTPESNMAGHLQTCCGMDTYDCGTALSDAQACLVDDLAPVKEAATDYLSCIGSTYFNGTCSFGNFCVAILTDGYGTGGDTDFAVGSGSPLAGKVAGAQTCEDPDLMSFGKSVCENASFCCQPCADKLAPVVNTVMDKILLPAYNTANLSDCGGDNTCADYTSSGRRDLEMVGPATKDIQNMELATGLASECVDTLATDLVVYNETFAVSNHFDCLSKKMGKIAAEMDTRAQESSSISLSFVSVTALSMIAAAIYSVIA